MLNILIADDHPLFISGLRFIINQEVDMNVVAEASSAEEAFELVLKGGIDLVVLDIGLPGRSGLDVLKDIKKLHPKMPVLIFSMHPEDRYAIRAIKSGASGYISKEEDSKTLIEAIRAVQFGRKYITPSIAEKLADELGKDIDKQPHELLSNREYEVLSLIATGKSVKDIAELLSLSINTINTYRMRILTKMNMKSNAELTYYMIHNKLID